MIRNYTANDFSQVCEIAHKSQAYLRPWLTKGESALAEDFKVAQLILVHQSPEGIDAFAYLDKIHSYPGGNELYFWIFVNPEHRGRGIERELWSALDGYIHKLKPNKVSTSFCTEWSEQQDLFFEAGFIHNFDSPRMEYTGPSFPEPKLTVIPYADAYFADYLRMYNEGFYELRRSINAQPFTLYDEKAFSDSELRKRTLNNSEGVYLFVDNGNLVGTIKLTDLFEELVIDSSHWGQGYGRALVQYGVNRLLERGLKPALYIVGSNTRAKKLYESQGFEITVTSRIMEKTYAAEKRG